MLLLVISAIGLCFTFMVKLASSSAFGTSDVAPIIDLKPGVRMIVDSSSNRIHDFVDLPSRQVTRLKKAGSSGSAAIVLGQDGTLNEIDLSTPTVGLEKKKIEVANRFHNTFNTYRYVGSRRYVRNGELVDESMNAFPKPPVYDPWGPGTSYIVFGSTPTDASTVDNGSNV